MKLKFLIGLFFFSTAFLLAQENVEDTDFVEEFPTPKFSFGMEFNLGVPLNDFRENLDQLAWGFSGSFMMRANPTSDLPLYLGLSGGVLFYDVEIQDQLVFIDGFTLQGRSTTRNGIVVGHGMFRILPQFNLPFQPYLDGMLGLKNFYTRTMWEELDPPDNEEALDDSFIEHGDFAVSYGGAIGLQMIVGHSEGVFILLDARCLYLTGPSADYLVRNEDPNNVIIDTIDAFEEKNSTTDLLIPQIGLSFVF